jgi:hypothetical protein
MILYEFSGLHPVQRGRRGRRGRIRPLFVFDQGKAAWFQWTREQWEAAASPVISHPHFTGRERATSSTPARAQSPNGLRGRFQSREPDPDLLNRRTGVC